MHIVTRFVRRRMNGRRRVIVLSGVVLGTPKSDRAVDRIVLLGKIARLAPGTRSLFPLGLVRQASANPSAVRDQRKGRERCPH